MNQEDLDNSSSFLQIKELKEKVRSLVSEVDLNRENAKFKHEKDFDNDLSSSVSSDECEEEFIDCSEIELRDETNWLSDENSYSESVSDICKFVYSDIDDDRPDITNICQQLESTSVKESNTFSYHKPSIDSRTFTRPKKYTVRPPLTSVVGSGDDGRPKLQRRLTTTISPTPNLISKLEELSKNNNRPVSGNYGDVNWQDGSEEGMAEMKTPIVKSKRQSLPASLFDRLQELKKANNAFKMPKVVEPSFHNGKAQEYGQSTMFEDAKKVSVALDLKNTQSSSRLSEIYRNTQDYYSDDNESFISLDEVSGFCDRLTLSTDQSTYSSIVKEMEQNEICLFHRTVNEDGLKFGSFDLSAGGLPRTSDKSQSADEDNDLNRTYEIDEENPDERGNGTFEVKRNQNPSRNHVMNATFDANRKSGLLDVILQSDVIKNLSPNSGVKKGNSSSITNNNYNNNNNNNTNNTNNNNNNNSSNNNNYDYNKIVTTAFEGNNFMNNTYDKLNGTLDQNELNALQKEKYSTKIFDSNYRRGGAVTQRSPTRSSNGKKDSDHSEDDCMSTTSDNSSRSIDSNSEAKTVEDFKNIAIQQSKKFSSTPIMEQRSKLEFEVVSPIRMEMGGGESRGISNPSSRGASPRRISASNHQEGWQKDKMPNIRQSLKVPQRELKLKPALIRPTMNFKRPLSSSRTSSEPSVPQKVESCSSAVGTTVLRPQVPTTTPSLTNIRPTSRTSGIPRPPTRLKQPQIRVNFSKK